MVPMIFGIVTALCFAGHGACDFGATGGHDRYVEAGWYQHADENVALDPRVKAVDEPIATMGAFLQYCEEKSRCNETATLGAATVTTGGVCHRVFVQTDNQVLVAAYMSEMNAQCNREA